MKESGSKIIEAAQKHGFENFEACLDELNKLPHDDKLEYLFGFLTSRVLSDNKIEMLTPADISAISQISNISTDKVSVDDAVKYYDQMCEKERLAAAREIDTDEQLRFFTLKIIKNRQAILEEEKMKKLLEKELVLIKKKENLHRTKDIQNKEVVKKLDSNLTAVRSSKQMLGDSIKVTNKSVEEIMGILSKTASEIIDFLERENKSEENTSKSLLNASGIIQIVQKYRQFITKIQEQLASISKISEKDSKTGELTNPELKQTVSDIKKLVNDQNLLKETQLNLKLYEKRILATESLLLSPIEKSELEKVKIDIIEEQNAIEKLHEDVKLNLHAACEWEINEQYSKYIEDLAGNDILALAPSILMQIEDLIKKHLVFFIFSIRSKGNFRDIIIKLTN